MPNRELSPEERALYLRQMMLPEVGDEGQRRICSATASVEPPAARAKSSYSAYRIASCYAKRAGFASLSQGEIAVESLAPEQWLSQPAAREFLAGARAAIGAIRAAIASGNDAAVAVDESRGSKPKQQAAPSGAHRPKRGEE